MIIIRHHGKGMTLAVRGDAIIFGQCIREVGRCSTLSKARLISISPLSRPPRDSARLREHVLVYNSVRTRSTDGVKGASQNAGQRQGIGSGCHGRNYAVQRAA